MAIARQAFTGANMSTGSARNGAANTTIGGGSFNGSSLLAGDVLVHGVFSDNLSASTPTFTIDSNPSEAVAWTPIGQTARNASAAAGCAIGMWMTTLTSNGTSSMTAPLVTASGAIAAHGSMTIAFRGASTTLRGSWQQANGASTTPSVVSSSAEIGDAVVGFASIEANALPTADSDTTNGSWDTQTGYNSTGGGSAANIAGVMQAKIVTGTGTQTYNLTSASTDWIAFAIVLQPAAETVWPHRPQILRPRGAIINVNWY